MSVDLPIYLDNHATTRCDPRVLDAMWPYFAERYGNAASRSHTLGHQARSAVERARMQIGTALGCSPKEVLFTSGATESNNLAILGVVRPQLAQQPHIITVVTEHKAVLDPFEQLRREGAEVTLLSVDADGALDLDAVADALRPNTALLSAMAVNNEIGTQHDLAALGQLCRANGTVFHVDAAQAVHTRPLHLHDQCIDLMSISGHKLYGPKGAGALLVRRGRPRFRVAPLQHGGGHERGMRSGTLAVPLIVGLGRAVELAVEGLNDGEADRVRALRDRLHHGLSQGIEGLRLNGPPLDARVGNNLNLSFDGTEAEALLMSVRELCMSTGSACTSATLEPSHVLRAIGVPSEVAHSSLRFGLGRFTTEAEVDHAVNLLVEKVATVRALSLRDFSAE